MIIVGCFVVSEFIAYSKAQDGAARAVWCKASANHAQLGIRCKMLCKVIAGTYQDRHGKAYTGFLVLRAVAPYDVFEVVV